MQVRLRMRGLGLSGTLARRVILRAQQTRYKGSGGYSAKAPLEQGGSIRLPQAEIEAADFESFFRLFPDYLVKDALKDKEVLDFGSGYGGRTVEYKLCGAKRVCGIEPYENVVALSQRYADYRGVHDVEFKVCGHKEIPYPDDSFDVVISYDVLAPIIRGMWRLATRAHGISRIDGGGCSGTLATRWRLRLRAGAALAALLMDRRRRLRWRARSRLERADSLRAAPS